MDTKKWVTSSVLVSVTAAGSLLLVKRDKRDQLIMNCKRLIAKVTKRRKEDHEDYYSIKIGHSDPHDIEDN
ncbi:hypothetical protein, partial [Pseudomonas sp. 2822-17]|uniref:hypothetical protein n=1 Tax=Pseudomonas sp. 2822-17 TaxID=1712678 RepID=UPI001C4560CB